MYSASERTEVLASDGWRYTEVFSINRLMFLDVVNKA